MTATSLILDLRGEKNEVEFPGLDIRWGVKAEGEGTPEADSQVLGNGVCGCHQGISYENRRMWVCPRR